MKESKIEEEIYLRKQQEVREVMERQEYEKKIQSKKLQGRQLLDELRS